MHDDLLAPATLLLLNDWHGRVESARRDGVGTGNGFLAAVRDDSDAFYFVRDIFELVTLPREAFNRAFGLKELAGHTPESLPPRLKLALQVGGIASMGLPMGVIPIVKGRFRAHLREILTTFNLSGKSASSSALVGLLKSVQATGAEPDFELWGGQVFGASSSARQASLYAAIAGVSGLKALTVDPARLLPPQDIWATDEPNELVALRLKTVAAACRDNRVELTFKARNYAQALELPRLVGIIINDPSFDDLVVGCSVYAELPDSVRLVDELLVLAAARSARGAKPVTVRITTKSMRAGELITSLEHGLAVAATEDPVLRDGQAIALLRAVLAAGEQVHTIFESDDTVLLALARVIAANAEASSFSLQLQRGVLPDLQQAIAGQLDVRVTAPIVRTRDFGDAIDETLSLLADVVDPEGAFVDHSLASTQMLQARIQKVLAASAEPMPSSHRLQDRRREWDPAESESTRFYKPPTMAHQIETGGLTAAVLSLAAQETGEIRLQARSRPQSVPAISDTGFANEPSTDATVPANRVWMRELMAAGDAQANEIVETLDGKLTPEWGRLEPQQRAATMRRAALALAAARDRLVTSIRAERGLTASEIDHEINTAIDATRYLASRAEGLRAMRGAQFEPDAAILLVADSETPFADFAESAAAILATGAALVAVIAQTLNHSARVLFEEWESAGLPLGSVVLVTAESGRTPTGSTIISEQAVAAAERYEVRRVTIHGDFAIADQMRRLHPDIIRDTRAPGTGTALITGSADAATAIKEIVKSALLHGGSHPRQTNAIILTGTAIKPKKLLKHLQDALTSNPQAARLSHPPSREEIKALTQLAPGENWALTPRQLDETGLLWSPGIRTGVKTDAAFWGQSRRLPVIGVITAATFDEAISAQSTVGSGTVAALYTRDQTEMIRWLELSRAATLSVNKSAARAQIERMPTGVWSSGGGSTQPLLGGPNRLLTLGNWTLREGTPSDTLHLRGLQPNVRAVIETSQSALDYGSFDRLRRAALADSLVWQTQYGAMRDVVRLQIEHNILRYRSASVHVRASSDATLEELARVLIAGMLSKSAISLSSARALPPKLQAVLELQGIGCVIEDDETWIERATIQGASLGGPGEALVEKIRLIGGDGVRVSEWLSSHPEITVWAEPVTIAGTVELFGFLREQAISIVSTRHGYASDLEEVEEWLQELAQKG